MHPEEASNSSSSAHQRNSLFREKDMNMREVLPLKASNELDDTEAEICKENDRILQKGFLATEGELLDLVRETFKGAATVDKATGQKKPYKAWVTDYAAPTPEAALMMNIAAELIVKYKVSTDDVQEKASEIYRKLCMEAPSFTTKVSQEVASSLEKETQYIEEKAKQELIRLNLSPTVLPNLIKLERLKRAKAITNDLVAKYVEDKFAENKNFDLETKAFYPNGQNKDISLLGAAGSGKSYTLRTFAKEVDPKDYVVLSTDAYRGIYQPESPEFSQQSSRHSSSNSSEQGFVKTQNSAYLIKELVTDRVKKLAVRPDVIIDCVTLEPAYNDILRQSAANTLSMVACMPEVRKVPANVYNRAVTATSAEDAGRHVNTTALLQGHKSASEARFFDALPFSQEGITTKFINTNTVNNGKPKVFAEAKCTNSLVTLTISDIRVAGDFFAKSNINEEAKQRQELYMRRKDKNQVKTHLFRYDLYYKARSILINLEYKGENPPKGKEKNIVLTDPTSGKQYFKITKIKDKNQEKFLYEIIDEKLFTQHLAKDPVLKEMYSQITTFNKVVTEGMAFRSVQGDRAILEEKFILGSKAENVQINRPRM
ncbi:MAG: hypothetical protein A3F18_04940 [Legionellales bacterium RIFCSPHIGHO2_12_FULL_37_14]|nr:MAG: hypothetical protein A3F18_04940 [Legionellales bacterium RIFCSPHIGHO2_12_FULL_37_14]